MPIRKLKINLRPGRVFFWLIVTEITLEFGRWERGTRNAIRTEGKGQVDAGRRTYARMLRVCLGIALASLAAAGSAYAQGAAPEYNIKAGYLLLFTRYVTWPGNTFPGPDSPILLCVIGSDPFGKVIDDTFRDMSSRGHRIEVRRARNADEARRCHMAFISRLEPERQAGWLDTLKRGPIFTVTETEDGIRSGSVVNFVMERKSLRFEVNLEAMEKAGLKISSPMLVSARKLHHMSED